MAGALAIELAEALDVLQLDRELAQGLVLGVDRFRARKMQQRVEQHRGVTGRQNEPVTVRPDRILGIEAQEFLPQRIGHRRHRHRRAGVARTGLLDSVDRQRPYGVDAELVERDAVLFRCTIHDALSRTHRLASTTERNAPTTSMIQSSSANGRQKDLRLCFLRLQSSSGVSSRLCRQIQAFFQRVLCSQADAAPLKRCRCRTLLVLCEKRGRFPYD